MKKLHALLMAAVVCVSLQAAAREVVPVFNQMDVPVVSATGQPLTAAQVKQAIQGAATATQWTLVEPVPGRLLATKQWRTHTIVTEISYAPDKYSLVYKDSTNMNYVVRVEQPMIHPYYNRYVRALNDNIRIALGRL